MSERKHILLEDSSGEAFKVYAGIPTIIPKGVYVFNETVDSNFIIHGEIERDVTWSFKERRWIIPKNQNLESKVKTDER